MGVESIRCAVDFRRLMACFPLLHNRTGRVWRAQAPPRGLVAARARRGGHRLPYRTGNDVAYSYSSRMAIAQELSHGRGHAFGSYRVSYYRLWALLRKRRESADMD